MQRDLIIAAGPGEWRAALIEDAEPVELYVERGDRAAIGSIHLGRVRERVAALDALLVDVGEERPGFLPLRDVMPAQRPLDDGARVIVQVKREAQRDKATRLTARVALRDRFLRLGLGAAAPSDSGALSPTDRARIAAAAGASQGVEIGPVERDAPLPPIDRLLDEAAALGGKWRALSERARHAEPPAPLDAAASLADALARRLPEPPDRVIVDDLAALAEIRAAFPDIPAEHRRPGDTPLDIDVVFDAALSPQLALPRGGWLHLEETRAATLIDVDTGAPETGKAGHVGPAVNLAATVAIARQIRLRNLGGAIIIDFVGMEGHGARDRVRAALDKALKPDPAAPQILGWTRLGHLEIVRPRRGRPLAAALLDPSDRSPRKAAATIAFAALRALARAAQARPSARWRLAVASPVAAALNGPARGGLRALEDRLGGRIAIEGEPGRERDSFEIFPL